MCNPLIRDYRLDKITGANPVRLSSLVVLLCDFVGQKHEDSFSGGVTMTELNNEIIEGKIAGPLVTFTMPIFLAMCLQSLYGAVDLLIVGQFATSADVSAIATGAQIMGIVNSIAIGLTTGTTILVGQAIGARRLEHTGKIIGTAICLFILLTVVLTVPMECFAVPIANIMQAPEEAFIQTVQYVRICSAGSLFVIFYNLLCSVFRGIGDSKTPLIAVTVASIINILGDLLLVAVFDMGTAGAAIATIGAQGISVLVSYVIIRHRGVPFPFGMQYIRFDGQIVRSTLKMGAPIALQDTLVHISFMVIMAIVNGLGVIASAGVGVAERLCSFIMLMPSAFSQAVSTFVAQNVGAGKQLRARKVLMVGIGISLSFGVIISYFSFFHGSIMCKIFSKDAMVVEAAFQYLRAYAIDTLLTSFIFCFFGYFNGCGNTTFVMIQGLIGAFGVRIPVSILMSRLEPTSLFLVGLATPASSFVQLILCVIFFAIVGKKTKPKALE